MDAGHTNDNFVLKRGSPTKLIDYQSRELANNDLKKHEQKIQKTGSKLPKIVNPISVTAPGARNLIRHDDAGDTGAGTSRFDKPVPLSRKTELRKPRIEDKQKVSHIPRRKANIKQPLKDHRLSTKTNPKSEKFFGEGANVQKIQFLDIKTEFCHEHPFDPNSLASSRPIPTLGELYGNNGLNSNQVRETLVEMTVSGRLNTPENSFESTPECQKVNSSSNSECTDQTVVDVEKITNCKVNTPSQHTNISNYANNVRKMADDSKQNLCSSDFYPTRDNENESLSIGAPTKVPKSKQSENMSTITPSNINWHTNMSNKSDTTLKQHSTITVDKTRDVFEYKLNEKSYLLQKETLKMNTGMEPVLIPKQGRNKFFQFPSTSVPEASNTAVPSYVDCPSEVLEKTTNLEILGCQSSKTLSSIAGTDLEIRDDCSDFTLEQDVYSFPEEISSLECNRCKSQRSVILARSPIESKPSDIISWYCQYHERNATEQKSSVSTNSPHYHYFYRKQSEIRRYDKKKRKFKQFLCSRHKISKQFRCSSHRFSWRRFCGRRWNFMWKKTTECCHNSSNSPSKFRKLRALHYRHRPIQWEHVNIQTTRTLLALCDAGTACSVQEGKSAATSINFFETVLPTFENLVSDKSSVLTSGCCRPKHVKLGPSMFLYSWEPRIDNTIHLSKQSLTRKEKSKHKQHHKGYKGTDNDLSKDFNDFEIEKEYEMDKNEKNSKDCIQTVHLNSKTTTLLHCAEGPDNNENETKVLTSVVKNLGSNAFTDIQTQTILTYVDAGTNTMFQTIDFGTETIQNPTNLIVTDTNIMSISSRNVKMPSLTTIKNKSTSETSSTEIELNYKKSTPIKKIDVYSSWNADYADLFTKQNCTSTETIEKSLLDLIPENTIQYAEYKNKFDSYVQYSTWWNQKGIERCEDTQDLPKFLKDKVMSPIELFNARSKFIDAQTEIDFSGKEAGSVTSPANLYNGGNEADTQIDLHHSLTKLCTSCVSTSTNNILEKHVSVTSRKNIKQSTHETTKYDSFIQHNPSQEPIAPILVCTCDGTKYSSDVCTQTDHVTSPMGSVQQTVDYCRPLNSSPVVSSLNATTWIKCTNDVERVAVLASSDLFNSSTIGNLPMQISLPSQKMSPVSSLPTKVNSALQKHSDNQREDKKTIKPAQQNSEEQSQITNDNGLTDGLPAQSHLVTIQSSNHNYVRGTPDEQSNNDIANNTTRAQINFEQNVSKTKDSMKNVLPQLSHVMSKQISHRDTLRDILPIKQNLVLQNQSRHQEPREDIRVTESNISLPCRIENQNRIITAETDIGLENGINNKNSLTNVTIAQTNIATSNQIGTEQPNQLPNLTIDRVTSEVARKHLVESIVQASPDKSDKAIACRSLNTENRKPANVTTSRFIFPNLTECHSVKCKQNSNDLKSLEQRHRSYYYSDIFLSDNEEMLPNDIELSDQQCRNVIEGILSAEAYKALIDTTKIVARNAAENALRNLRLHKKASRSNYIYKSMRNTCVRSCSVCTDLMFAANGTMESRTRHRPLVENTTQTLSFYQTRLLKDASEFEQESETFEYIIKNNFRNSFRYYRELLSKQLDRVKAKFTQDLDNSFEETLYRLQTPQKAEFVEDTEEFLHNSEFSQKMDLFKEAFTMKPSGREETYCQTQRRPTLFIPNAISREETCRQTPKRRLFIPNAISREEIYSRTQKRKNLLIPNNISSCILPPVLSTTNISAQNDQEYLNSIYHGLIAIEGRIRRLKGNIAC